MVSRVKSMFNSKVSDYAKGVIYKPGKLVPIFSSEELLRQKSHQFCLEQIQALSKLPAEHFTELYVSMVQTFAAYAQVLPREWDAPLSSLLNHSLERGLRVLQHLDQEHVAAGALERFAMFSAGLLCDLASIVTNQKVFITTEEGVAVKEWQPFAGPLHINSDNKYYRLQALGKHFQRMERATLLLLLRQVIPDKAFLWLADNLKIFMEWLAALEDDESDGGRFRKILQLYEFPVEENRPMRLPSIEVPLNDSAATQYADLFIEWLKKAIANGDVSVNGVDSDIMITDDGAFLDKKIFKKFTDLYDVPVSMFTVYEQFGNLLGLNKLGGLDYRVEQLYAPYNATTARQQNFLGQQISQPARVREGAFVGEAAILFLHGPIPPRSPYIRALADMQVAQLQFPKLSTFQIRPDNKI